MDETKAGQEAGVGEYQCGACKGVFPKVWSDEEAMAESHAIFGEMPPEDTAIVCDVCYREMMGLPPEEPAPPPNPLAPPTPPPERQMTRVPPMRLLARDVAAYLLDRADQYDTESPCWIALAAAAENIMRGEVGNAERNGDFDAALYARVDGFTPQATRSDK